MHKESGSQKAVLPKLAGMQKQSQEQKGQLNSKGFTLPNSCPTIKGLVGEAISYYQGKNSTATRPNLHIFSVSFQNNLDKGSNIGNPNIIIPNYLSKEKHKFRYDTFEKFTKKHRNAIMDTSFLLGKFAQQNNQGVVRSRNPKQAFVQAERLNRSEKIRQELMLRYSNKQKKAEKFLNDNNANSNLNLKLINPETEFSENLRRSKHTERSDKKQASRVLHFDEQMPSLQDSYEDTIHDSEDRKTLEQQKVESYGKLEDPMLYRLYVTRTNIQAQAKKSKLMQYPAINKKSYKFCLGPGNNAGIVKEILEKRGNWAETSEHDTLFHIKWEQTTDKPFYKRLNFSRYKQMVNHLLAHECITSKSGLLQTLKHFLQRHQANNNLKPEESLNCFDLVPVTFSFDWDERTKFEEELKRFIFYYSENHPDHERRFRMERDYVDLIKEITGQKSRHLNLTMNKHQLLRKNHIPPLSSVYKSAQNKYLWIIKPSELNRGRGIKIFSKLEQLAKILKQSIVSGDFVIQKYIEKPMLVEGRKFDIRVWVLVDSEGQSYFFEEGYIRTSSQPFNLQNGDTNNQFVHLTNNAVQKNNENYGMYEDGNQLSFMSFDKLIKKPDGYFKENFVPSIKDICSLVMQAGIKKKMLGNIDQHYSPSKQPSKAGKETKQKKVLMSDMSSQTFGPAKNPSIPKSTFQIFGFDYMIDQNEKLWLIEVNTNPCIETSSKLLENLLPRMIDDAFKKTIDLVFKPSKCPVYNVPGYDDLVNMFSPLSHKQEQVMGKFKKHIEQPVAVQAKPQF